MFCSKCGEILRDGTRKCPVCGAVLNQRTSAVNDLRPQPRAPRKTYDRTHYECERDDCTQVNFSCRHGRSGKSGSSVGFLEACRLFFVRYGDYKGRSTRSEFWWASLMLLLVSMLLADFSLAGAWVLLTLIPSVTLSIRRLHDVGIPGLLVLVTLIPFVGGILFLVMASRPSGPANQWGEPAV